MKKILDSNVVLRFLLKDDEKMFKFVCELLNKSKSEGVQLQLLTITVFEIIYVLEKVYKISRAEISSVMSDFINSQQIHIESVVVLNEALRTYPRLKIDIQDIYLFFYARANNLKLISFDKDIVKLERRYN